MTENQIESESLLPYARWAEEAMRVVVLEALAYTAEHGLPGDHHFYLTFRTDHPGVSMPGHLKARYPQEMTIVLQHRFWDLKVDRINGSFAVGLSFGGVPASLTVPLKAMTAFADPHARFGLRFQVDAPPVAAESATADPASAEEPAPAVERPQVVSLDAFRRRPARE